ncbi:hypothetical protein HXX76_010142 [Chlamydomonas incerta]|uniref:Uncharacterized protein n=1 Tax=Chlamydomonas incerta TaxID=51695 RepID=A0A835SYM1_CHLIN|nr:hypothetical protein HXX76_010142 [Chlamydomonas incerta]|eukprot:KAG2430624.1 hypothetical protein HXX76_010142 [Chlamydomonas incerta]
MDRTYILISPTAPASAATAILTSAAALHGSEDPPLPLPLPALLPAPSASSSAARSAAASAGSPSKSASSTSKSTRAPRLVTRQPLRRAWPHWGGVADGDCGHWANTWGEGPGGSDAAGTAEEGAADGADSGGRAAPGGGGGGGAHDGLGAAGAGLPRIALSFAACAPQFEDPAIRGVDLSQLTMAAAAVTDPPAAAREAGPAQGQDQAPTQQQLPLPPLRQRLCVMAVQMRVHQHQEPLGPDLTAVLEAVEEALAAGSGDGGGAHKGYDL